MWSHVCRHTLPRSDDLITQMATSREDRHGENIEHHIRQVQWKMPPNIQQHRSVQVCPRSTTSLNISTGDGLPLRKCEVRTGAKRNYKRFIIRNFKTKCVLLP